MLYNNTTLQISTAFIVSDASNESYIHIILIYSVFQRSTEVNIELVIIITVSTINSEIGKIIFYFFVT